MVRCWGLPQGAVAVDIWQASPRIFMPNDVPPCHCHQQEWAWPFYLLGQMGTLSGKDVEGDHLLWSSSDLIPPGRSRPLPQCLPAMGVAGEDTLWWGDRGKYLPGYPGLCQRMPLLKWLSALSGKEPRWSPAGVPRLNPQAEFNARNHNTYDRFMDIKWDSCEEVLAIARDAHHWVLGATALLEDKIERMSCSLSQSHQCSGSHRCSGSHQQRRSQTADHWTKVSQATSHHGDTAKRQTQSPALPNQDSG